MGREAINPLLIGRKPLLPAVAAGNLDFPACKTYLAAAGRKPPFAAGQSRNA
jgi:hypothetical protein